ncbi:MAG: ATP-binding cassette domain-containing protein [Gammaproteobacteria bacterium]|nr:ATP-binding cassette domain-containing protein [Gammaproteobacteria bacterium]
MESEPTQHPCIELRNVGIVLGDQWILREVDLDIPNYQCTGIVGASGSGKTTLLQLVLGIHRPNEGSILVQGQPIPEDNLERFRRGIGYAVQSAGLFPHMTIFRNIGLMARLEKWDSARIDNRIQHLFELMDLPLELGDRYPYELSSGQQHRAGLCRAMMLEPSMFLLDEPFSTIDPVTRREIQLHFKRIQAQLQLSTLLVTHDMAEARLLSDYLVVIGNHGVVQHGPTEEVIKNPESEIVQALLATLE